MKHARNMHGAYGAYPVSVLAALPDAQALVVRALRQWCSSPEGPEQVYRTLTARLGRSHGLTCHQAMGEMMHILQRHARRAFVRHGADCRYVGSDEAILAHFVTIAATGAREDAMLIASLLLEGRYLLPFTEAAQQVGLFLLRIEPEIPSPGPIPDPLSPLLH